MAMFQCAECGCTEDFALGWLHGNEPIKDFTTPEMVGKRVCSACAPAKWSSEVPIDGYGSWHAQFPRVYYPHGKFKNTKAYKEKHGRKRQYKKPKG